MFNYQRLKARRVELDLTLEDVGAIAGISRSAVQKYEKGIIKNVYVSMVEQFAKALRCNPAYLLGWVDTPELENAVGDALTLSNPERNMVLTVRDLNDEGQEKIADYLDDLKSSGKYKKLGADRMGNEKMA